MSLARNERGDTLIEVSIALSILAAVLLSANTVVARALITGETAKERSSVAESAQEQVEELRSFRDDSDWSVFQNGQASPLINGVLMSTADPSCTKSAVCFHMERKTIGTTTEYVPMPGQAHGTVPTSYLEIQALPGPIVAPLTFPASVDFVVSYGFKTIGGGADNVNTIRVRLTDLQLTPP